MFPVTSALQATDIMHQPRRTHTSLEKMHLPIHNVGWLAITTSAILDKANAYLQSGEILMNHQDTQQLISIPSQEDLSYQRQRLRNLQSYIYFSKPPSRSQVTAYKDDAKLFYKNVRNAINHGKVVGSGVASQTHRVQNTRSSSSPTSIRHMPAKHSDIYSTGRVQRERSDGLNMRRWSRDTLQARRPSPVMAAGPLQPSTGSTSPTPVRTARSLDGYPPIMSSDFAPVNRSYNTLRRTWSTQATAGSVTGVPYGSRHALASSHTRSPRVRSLSTPSSGSQRGVTNTASSKSSPRTVRRSLERYPRDRTTIQPGLMALNQPRSDPTDPRASTNRAGRSNSPKKTRFSSPLADIRIMSPLPSAEGASEGEQHGTSRLQAPTKTIHPKALARRHGI